MPNTKRRRKPEANASTRLASMRINSFDADTGTFSAIAATGTAIPRSDFFNGDYSEVLSLNPAHVRLTRFQSGRAALLDSHRSGSTADQIGVVTDGRIENGLLVVDCQLSPRDDVKPIAEDIAAGILRNVSIGYRVFGSIDAGSGDNRTITHTDWEPMEVSIVPVGADPQAFIRSSKGQAMPNKRNSRPAHQDNDSEGDLDVRHDDAINDGSADTNLSARDIREIQRICARAPDDFSAAFVNDIVSRANSVTHAREMITNELARRSARNPISTAHAAGADDTFDNPTFLQRTLEDALYARMAGTPATGPAAEWRGRSLLEIGAAVVQSRGETVRWGNRDRLAAQIMARGIHTTSDFPNLLQNSGQRVLLSSYESAASALKQVARRIDANDFRAISMLRISDAPRLLEVGEAGEVKHGTRYEAKESYKLKTFARIFSLSRNAIINDDLGAFADSNMAWGRATAETEAQELVSLLTANTGDGVNLDDGSPLYGTSRGNKAASGAAPDVTKLSDARKAMRNFKALDGTTLVNVSPKYLCVGSDNETLGEQLLTSLNPTSTTQVNPFSNKLELLVEPRLSGAAWRLFADPGQVAALCISYLSGAEGPQVTARHGFDVLGIEFQCLLDFGCGPNDWRGSYLNPGP